MPPSSGTVSLVRSCIARSHCRSDSRRRWRTSHRPFCTCSRPVRSFLQRRCPLPLHKINRYPMIECSGIAKRCRSVRSSNEAETCQVWQQPMNVSCQTSSGHAAVVSSVSPSIMPTSTQDGTAQCEGNSSWLFLLTQGLCLQLVLWYAKP
jgi:hypothetical protein